jgi:hypothetical protein
LIIIINKTKSKHQIRAIAPLFVNVPNFAYCAPSYFAAFLFSRLGIL